MYAEFNPGCLPLASGDGVDAIQVANHFYLSFLGIVMLYLIVDAFT